MSTQKLPAKLVMIVALFAVSATSKAENPVTWNIDIFTTGDDVFWTSPAPITLGLPEYDWSYEITKLSADVSVVGERDLLTELGDDAVGSGTTSTLPLVLFDEFLEENVTGSSANLRIAVDASGFGQASGTNITLGSVGIFSIERVDLEATVSIVGIATGDYNRDGAVDVADYAIWKSDFGSTSNLLADGNDNGAVDAADYTLWRDHLNVNSGAAFGAASIAAVPEPGSLSLFLAIFVLSAGRRAVRPS